MSDGKPAPQNIQDAFLNTIRRDKATVTVYLVNGAKLLGKIRSFDKFSVLLESGAQRTAQCARRTRNDYGKSRLAPVLTFV